MGRITDYTHFPLPAYAKNNNELTGFRLGAAFMRPESRGGRPPSRLGLNSRNIAHKWCRDHKAPLEVMLGNMAFYDQQAAILVAQALRWRSGPKNLEEARARIQLLKSLDDHRQRAQDCARDAAPYVHPKLQTIEAGAKTEAPFVICFTPGDDKL